MKKSISLFLSIIVLSAGCKKAETDPEIARQMIVHRNLGLAYLEENKLREAAAEFQKLIALAPGEPLGYANLGVIHFRLRQFEAAEKALHQALRLAPDHPDLCLMQARVYEFTERGEEAIQRLENSLKKNPGHVRTLHLLTQYYLNASSSGNKQKAGRLLRAEENLAQVVHALPANVAARLELVELLLQNGKPARAVEHMETIRQILPELPAGAPEIFQQSVELMQSGNAAQALTPARMFRNVLKSSSFYQTAIVELQGRGGTGALEPFSHFVRPVTLHKQRAGIPAALSFTEVTTASGLNLAASAGTAAPDHDPSIVMACGDYDGDGDQDLFVSQWRPKERAGRQYLFVNHNGAFSDSAARAGISHAGRDLSAFFGDYDNDGYLDLFITNTTADRLYHNDRAGGFREVTAAAGIETAGSRAALFADLDLEGDLDLFIAGASQNRFYRNNSDGTFMEIAEEAGLAAGKTPGRDALFGDFDDDGDLDLLLSSENAGVQYFDNLRQGYFRDITGHTGLQKPGNAGAVTGGDYNNDGYLDLFLADPAGAQHALFRNRGDGTFERDARSDSVFAGSGEDAAFFDADNDGFLDLLIAGAASGTAAKRSGLRLLYNDGGGKYSDAATLPPGLPEACRQMQITDYDNDGDLDIFAAGAENIHLLRNDGGNLNNYLTVRLLGLRTGSGKNNYFGIGAKVEVKAGALTQMRVMNEPVAHFGLGQQQRAELVRVLWSNGTPQNWFNPERNQTIIEDQTLKGSCPWLYAWNGREYEFVTDVLWTSALGMPLGIMGGKIGYAFANSGQDYFKVPGEMLQPQNGKYLLQFTSELWEASYVDQIALFAVDHPESLEIFVDEKFTPPPYPALRVYAVADQRPPVSARDEKGNDLLPLLAQRDGEYVANFIPGKYQGITAPHDLVLDLGDLSRADSIFLFLHGWIFPTDASINVNTSQSRAVRAAPPSLQVVDENGAWQTVIAGFGFPKGKNKTLVLDLSGKFPARDYRIRIQTNMQIYWDHIFYATKVSADTLQMTALPPAAADLHYRGFSAVTRATPYSPHLPRYHTVSTAPKWRDLAGMYTRYGDVLPLLLEADSRYVIMNAGDEMTLAFDAARLPALPAGWKRDFLFYNDGWVKDGDLNTAHGQTVAPLPFQNMKSYPYGANESYPGGEEDLDYQRTYNTRAVTAERFRRALFTGSQKTKQ